MRRDDTTAEHITKKAKREAARWSNQDRALFHCYNPNGVIARLDKAAPAALEGHKERLAYLRGRLQYMTRARGFSRYEVYHVIASLERIAAEVEKC